MSLADDAIAYFTSKGWTKEQAAGIVGNLHYESNGLDPNAVGDSGQAYGLGQWHIDRQLNFQRIFGKSIKGSSAQDQLAFVQWELSNTEQYAGTVLKKATTVADATKAFMSLFERPANSSSLTDRIKAANNALVGGAQSVADANVNNGFDWTFGASKAVTDWVDGKITQLGNNFIGLIAGLVGVVVIIFGLYQLVKDPISNAKGTAAKIALAA